MNGIRARKLRRQASEVVQAIAPNGTKPDKMAWAQTRAYRRMKVLWSRMSRPERHHATTGHFIRHFRAAEQIARYRAGQAALRAKQDADASKGETS